jgi:hypothetical protein
MVTKRSIHNYYIQKEMFSPSCVHIYLRTVTLHFFTDPVKKKRDTLYIIEHLTQGYKKQVINNEQRLSKLPFILRELQ